MTVVMQQEGGPWRPANGTDGMAFDFHWCRHCQNRDGAGDWEDEFGNDVEGACPIAEAMFWTPNYQPTELVIRHGQPWCTAFRQDPEVPSRCLLTKGMSL